MNKNIIIVVGIAAVLIVGALWATGIFDELVSPIEATDFSGEWKQEIVITYADGTTKTLGTAGTATLYHGDAVITQVESFLYINPTNIAGSYSTLTMDFAHDAGDFSQLYNMISPSGIYEIDGSEASITREGVSLESVGFVDFYIDTSAQIVGTVCYKLGIIDEFILSETGGYVMEIYYTGSAKYQLDSGPWGDVPAPDGVITIDFSRSLTAGIINFGWSPDYYEAS